MRSEEGILNSLEYAFTKFGYPVPPREQLKVFIGPPLGAMFCEFCGVTREDSDKLLAYYREYYEVDGWSQCELYDGVEAMLRRLCGAKKRCYVVSSKPQPFVEKIVQRFGIAPYIYGIHSAGITEKSSDKTLLIANAMMEAGALSDEVLMVGDRKFDAVGAKNNGVKCIGVTYGYGSREELVQAGATFLAATADEVADICLGEQR